MFMEWFPKILYYQDSSSPQFYVGILSSFDKSPKSVAIKHIEYKGHVYEKAKDKTQNTQPPPWGAITLEDPLALPTSIKSYSKATVNKTALRWPKKKEVDPALE